MGWAIQRADGSYRTWDAGSQADALLPGEAWVQMAACPAITAGAGQALVRPTLPGSVTADDVLRWALNEINTLRAGLAAPLPAIDVTDARAAAQQLSKRKER